MNCKAAHWDTYLLREGDLVPLPNDPCPSRIGRGWVSAARDTESRIPAPMVRLG